MIYVLLLLFILFGCSSIPRGNGMICYSPKMTERKVIENIRYQKHLTDCETRAHAARRHLELCGYTAKILVGETLGKSHASVYWERLKNGKLENGVILNG